MLKKIMILTTAIAVAFGVWAKVEFTIESGVLVGVKPNGEKAIVIPDGVKGIGQNVFDAVMIGSVTNVVVPLGVEWIGDDAFSNCLDLESIYLPESVTNIGDSAFSFCIKLAHVDLPVGIKRIGDMAFCNCSRIVTITLPPSVVSLGRGAFEGCNSLAEVNIPQGVKLLADNLFANCDGLRGLAIPEGVESIGNNTFSGAGIQRISIPKSLKRVGSDAFTFCSNLREVHIEDVSSWCKIVFDDTQGIGSNPLFFASNGLYVSGIPVTGNVVIAFGPTNVCDYAFGHCSAMTSVTVPESVTTLHSLAFDGCERLSRILLPQKWNGRIASNFFYTGGNYQIQFYEETSVVTPVAMVRFDSNGGGVGEASRNVKCGSSVGTLPTPTRDGYLFLGWFTAATGGIQVTESTVVSNDVTWHAHWMQNSGGSASGSGSGAGADGDSSGGSGIVDIEKVLNNWHTSYSDHAEPTWILVGEDYVYVDEVSFPYVLPSSGAVLNKTKGGYRLDLKGILLKPHAFTYNVVDADGDLAIYLENENVIEGRIDLSGTSGALKPLPSSHRLLIFGPGKLTLLNDGDNRSNSAIWVEDDLSIMAGATVSIYGCGWGIRTHYGNVLISGSMVGVYCSSYRGIECADLNVLAGMLSVQTTHQGIYVKGNTVIDASIVNVFSPQCCVDSSNFYASHSYLAFAATSLDDSLSAKSTADFGEASFDNCVGKFVGVASSSGSSAAGIRANTIEFGEGDYFIGFKAKRYNGNPNLSMLSGGIVAGVNMSIAGGNLVVCSPFTPGIWGSMEIQSGLLEFVENMDVAEMLKYDALAVAGYTAAIGAGIFDASTAAVDFYTQVFLDALSDGLLENVEGPSSAAIMNNYGSVYVQRGGTVLDECSVHGCLLDYNYAYAVIAGGSCKMNFNTYDYVNQGYSFKPTAPVALDGESFVNLRLMEYAVSGAHKKDKIVRDWTNILPSYYGTQSLYADDGGKLYFWLPETGAGGSLPNLAVGATTASKTSLEFSDSVTIRWRIENNGNVKSGENDIAFLTYDYDAEADNSTLVSVEWIACPALSAGSGKDFTKVISGRTLGEGIHSFVVYADGREIVPESVEDDNFAAVAVIVAKSGEYLTVSLDANGGNVPQGIISVAKGTAVGTLPTPEREGFAFLGWFTAAGGTQVTATTKVTKDVTYYAHWQYQGAADDSTIVFETKEEYTTAGDGSFTLDLSEVVGSASTPKFTVKGLPAGLKFDAKTLTISGKATKPGVYTITVSATNATVKKAEATTFEIVVPNLSCDALPGLMPETDAYGVIRCGVAFDPDLVDCSPEDGWTVKVAGLPAGLKWDAKTGTITGVPTKAGTFTVTFTATKKGEKNQTATITLKTEALPAWAVGSFVGIATGQRGAAGATSMSVTEAGKISGKFAIGGTNWTFAASSYAACYDDVCYAEVTAKAGRLARTFTIEVSPYDSPDGTLVNAETLASIEDEGIDLYFHRNMWKDKATAAAAKSLLQGLAGVYTATIVPDDEYGAGYLSLTISASGDVKASGKLADGTAVSSSVPLWWDGWGYVAWFAATPSAYKGGGVEVRIAIPQERGTVESGYCNWASRLPTATGEYGEGFVRESGVVCAYYDKLEKLNAYYKTLRLRTEAPNLEYTFKETFIDNNNRKQTATYLEYAEAADTLSQDGTTVSVNEKGAFTVAKATKPVQDKTTKEWSYEGANDGALTLSFTQATGIFKGSYTFWYDYLSAYDETTDRSTMAHTSKKVSFEGIWVQGSDSLNGFYLWDATEYYDDPKTGREKSYRYKESHGVRLAP